MIDSSHPPEAPERSQGRRILVRHLTRFVYEGIAMDSFNEAKLKPLSDILQTCDAFSLEVNQASSRREFRDFFQNPVIYFEVLEPHTHLEVEARSEVRTHPDPRGPVPSGLGLEALGGPSLVDNYFDFLSDSAFVCMEAPFWREAIDVLPAGVQDMWGDFVRLAMHIKHTFRYDPKTTTVNTQPLEVLEARAGVCQDFAHVLLSLCRCQGLPARYVSGYFINDDRLPGEIEASHAWVEVFLPGYGWKGFDPTHGRAADDRYVRLAIGRDYADIRPLHGTFRGRGTRQLIVEVAITSGR